MVYVFDPMRFHQIKCVLQTARTMSVLWGGEEPDDNNAKLYQRAHVEVQSFKVELQHLFEEYERAKLSA